MSAGDSEKHGNLGSKIFSGRGRSPSTVSADSGTISGSLRRDSSLESDTFVAKMNKKSHKVEHHGRDTLRLDNTIAAHRSRSHSRGRLSVDFKPDGQEEQRLFPRFFRSRQRVQPPGVILSIFNNMKPFSRDSRVAKGERDARSQISLNANQANTLVPATYQASILQSPAYSNSSSMKSRRSLDNSSLSALEERANERDRSKTHSRKSSAGSLSSSSRRHKRFPSLANFVPTPSSGSSEQSSSNIFTAGSLKILGRRSTSVSQSSSHSRLDELPSGVDTTLQMSGNLSMSQSETPNRKRGSSSAALRRSLSSNGNTLVSSSLQQLTPSKGGSDFVNTKPSADTINLALRNSNLTGASEPESKRHVEYPLAETTLDASRRKSSASSEGLNPLSSNSSDATVSFGCQSQREKTSFLRVYRPDGTFGTIVCPLNISSEQLLKLAARKFFISDASEYHLVALRPNSVRILVPEAKPAQLIRDHLIHAGYHSIMDKVDDVSRDDTSFLCRIVLSNINESLRPPLLMQGLRELVVQDTDVVDAPSLAYSDARYIETLDVSRSAFQGTQTRFPRLKHFKATKMLYLNGFSVTIAPQFNLLLENLTSLDFSGCGMDKLDGIDFMKAPNLNTLNIRGNRISELPENLFHLPFLGYLLCGTNSLTRFDIWNPSLIELDLSYNKISRLTLKNEESLQMMNLVTLQLSANALESLPDSIRFLPVLKELDTRHNMILNPLESIPPTVNTLVASYNNPRLHKQKLPSSPVANEKDPQEAYSVIDLPNIRILKLEGMHALELHTRFSMASLTVLDMQNTHLAYIHESLFENSKNLRTLQLSNNSLTRLPDSFNKLRNLEELYISNNSLVDLPASLLELNSLRVLDAHANNLRNLPTSLLLGPNLRILNLASNLIASLPGDPNAPFSHSLVQLTLCDNQLTEECFIVIMKLTTLRILDLGYNIISEIPTGVFSQLPALEELYLSGNRISTLPHDDFIHASQLRVLHVNGNKLHTLPAELSKASRLEVLDAAANQLRYNVANWPFDWNWRWNRRLRYLNFSSNRRLEIRRSPQFLDEATGVVDMADLCVLPNLATLGLMDVTLTTNSVPFQTENCRVRTFGSDLPNFRVGIFESLGFRPLANNDLVVERFRGRNDEFLVAIFDGQNESPGGGNRISHLAQDTFASVFKREMQVKDSTTVDALRRAFLSTHREIGNTALLSAEEIAHTSLGHRNSTASRLSQADWSAGTGATVVYFQGPKFYVATIGGARVVLSRANGTHTVLSKPLPPVSAELDRIRSSGGTVNPLNSYVDGVSPHPRLIGCYTSGTVFSAAPSIYEYDFETLTTTDQIIIGSSGLWEVMRHEMAADIVCSSSQDPVLAAMKLRDFALAYGMRDRMIALVIGQPIPQNVDGSGRNGSSSDIYDEEMTSFRKRRQSLPEDSTLARLGTEVNPPFGEITMVFTDIKSSTNLWESYPSVMRAAIKTHNSLMRRSIRLMDGYEVKNEGDAFIISFHTPVKALLWCLTVQQHLLTAEWPPELLENDVCSPVNDDNGNLIFRGLSVRMGIHCGRPVAEPDPVTKRMDYFGPMVNRASRISGIALGGQISVSSDFLNMLQRDTQAHKKVLNGIPVPEAYNYTSPSNATMLERSAAVLDHSEYVVKELGELKLRGIENPEQIFNIYPVSLASREKLYIENDTEERFSHSQIRPEIINRSSIGTTSSEAPNLAINAENTSAATNLGDNASDISGSAVTALDLSGAADPTLTYSVMDGSSVTSSPRVSLDSESRIGDAAPCPLPRQSTRSIGTVDANFLRSKHMLHKKTAGLPVASFANYRLEALSVCDHMQLLSRRLEAVSLAKTRGCSLHSVQQLLEVIDPIVLSGSEFSELAMHLWVTRIEATIAQLQEHQMQNP